jgi:hypothetical protein
MGQFELSKATQDFLKLLRVESTQTSSETVHLICSYGAILQEEHVEDESQQLRKSLTSISSPKLGHRG